MNRKYSIREYEYFTRNIRIEEKAYHPLPEKVFDILLACVLSSFEDFDFLQDSFILRNKKGMGTVLQAKNYVGALLLKDGTTIEILPKITEDLDMSKKERAIFMDMLKCASDIPIRKVGEASLASEKCGLFQWFVKTFLDETKELVKKGLCSSYQLEEGNEPYLKGRLIFSKHMVQNAAQKQYFYVEKDVFYENRPENRLIKTTLVKLSKEPMIKDRITIMSLLSYFEQIPLSFQIEEDFKKCRKDRQTKNYNSVLSWCQIFLNQKKFSSFYGSEHFLSILFPMDSLFEQYVAKKFYHRFRHICNGIKIQEKGIYLFEYPEKRFELIPDIVLYPKKSKEPILFDTKWKRLDNKKRNYGISQEDIYQMYVYGSCFHGKKVILLYPKGKEMEQDIILGFDGKMELKVMWIDLFDLNKSMDRIEKELNL